MEWIQRLATYDVRIVSVELRIILFIHNRRGIEALEPYIAFKELRFLYAIDGYIQRNTIKPFQNSQRVSTE